MNDYKKCMKLLNSANYVFNDEIDCFEFKKISKYKVMIADILGGK